MTTRSDKDRTHPPAPAEIQLALGSCFSLWKRLTHFVEKTYQAEGVWSTWGPAGYGWGFRYKYRGRSLTAFYPQKEHIIIQVVLSKAQAERALQLELGEKVSLMLRESPQLRDGRWLFIPVNSESDARDVEALLLVKMPPPR
ncbi:MAG: DUF3788 family protein [Promethearchaeota archaeon]